MYFSVCLARNRHLSWPGPDWGIVPPKFSVVLFPRIGSFYQTHGVINTLLRTWGRAPARLSVQLSSLQCSAQKILVSLEFADSQLYLLNSGCWFSPTWRLLPSTTAWKLSRPGSLSFFGLMSSILSCCFIQFMQCFHCFRQEGKSHPCHCILVRSRSLWSIYNYFCHHFLKKGCKHRLLKWLAWPHIPSKQ